MLMVNWNKSRKLFGLRIETCQTHYQSSKQNPSLDCRLSNSTYTNIVHDGQYIIAALNTEDFINFDSLSIKFY